MIEIQGHYYQQGSSKRDSCILTIDGNGNVTLLDDAGNLLARNTWQRLDVSSRLGNTPRFLTFPEGPRVETAANDSVDQLVQTFSPQPFNRWLHRLETNKRFVLLTLVIVIAFIWVTARYGAPALANVGSKWVPQEVVKIIGEQSLASLDKIYFDPTTLSPEVQDRVRHHLEPLLEDHSHLQLRVIFRSNKDNSPNAFALPDGTLVLTDAMVNMAKEDDELLAIAAHEVGHVQHRHGMRHIIQSSVLAFLAAIISGDISGTSEIFLGLPVMMTELSYSRKFETEADDYAFNWLRDHHKSTLLFANIMSRLEQATKCDDKQKDCKTKTTGSSKWLDYFSTHPPTDERITKAVNGNGK